MREATRLAADDVSRDVVYRCSGAVGADVVFTLSLPFLDETRDPAEPGLLRHDWVLPRGELERAEDQGASDDLILEIRQSELRRFLHMIERMLGERGAWLVRSGPRWALRHFERRPGTGMSESRRTG